MLIVMLPVWKMPPAYRGLARPQVVALTPKLPPSRMDAGEGGRTPMDHFPSKSVYLHPPKSTLYVPPIVRNQQVVWQVPHLRTEVVTGWAEARRPRHHARQSDRISPAQLVL